MIFSWNWSILIKTKVSYLVQVYLVHLLSLAAALHSWNYGLEQAQVVGESTDVSKFWPDWQNILYGHLQNIQNLKALDVVVVVVLVVCVTAAAVTILLPYQSWLNWKCSVIWRKKIETQLLLHICLRRSRRNINNNFYVKLNISSIFTSKPWPLMEEGVKFLRE